MNSSRAMNHVNADLGSSISETVTPSPDDGNVGY
jgi:hypothetical protein